MSTTVTPFFVIAKNDPDEDTPLYWSNDGGWFTLQDADRFTEEERRTLTLPTIGAPHAAWVPLADVAGDRVLCPECGGMDWTAHYMVGAYQGVTLERAEDGTLDVEYLGNEQYGEAEGDDEYTCGDCGVAIDTNGQEIRR